MATSMIATENDVILNGPETPEQVSLEFLNIFILYDAIFLGTKNIWRRFKYFFRRVFRVKLDLFSIWYIRLFCF